MNRVVDVSVTLCNEKKTRALGAVIARELRGGDVVILSGELGAGKTTFVKGLVGSLDATVEVTSPTFALCHRYACSPPIAHVDCWRMKSTSELADLALEELLDDGWVALIEWGERLGGIFDDEALTVTMVTSGDARVARLSTRNQRWSEISSRVAGSSNTFGEPQ